MDREVDVLEDECRIKDEGVGGLRHGHIMIWRQAV